MSRDADHRRPRRSPAPCALRGRAGRPLGQPPGDVRRPAGGAQAARDASPTTWLLGLVLLLAGGCGSGDDPLPGDGPHLQRALVGQPAGVIVLMLDTLRADHTGFGGAARPTTPTLDELAGQSLVFERAYANASWTRPSVATLFSARLPSAHGCVNRDGLLVPAVETLAEALSGAGYAARGLTTNGNVHPDLGFGQGFDSYRHLPNGQTRPYVGIADDDATAGLEQELAALADEPGPAFLYLHYVDPHDPFHWHAEHDFAAETPGEFDGSREAIDGYRHAGEVPPAGEVARAKALYDGEIAWLDQHLRRVLGRLDEAGLLETSWLVVTSDHGEGLWDHGIPGHGPQVYEEQVRVPLLLRPPGGLAGGRRVDAPIGLLDVAPTLLELVGVDSPAGFQGRSWVAGLTGAGALPVRPVVIDEVVDHFDLSAIIDGDDKLIIDRTRRFEKLFDLTDGWEDRQRAADVGASRDGRGSALRRALDQALAAARASAPRADGGPGADDLLDDETKAQLDALGYAGHSEQRDATVEPATCACADSCGCDGLCAGRCACDVNGSADDDG